MSSTWETTELHLAAYNCDLEWLNERIAVGDDVNLKDSSGFAPLHWCALRGRVGENQHDIAKALLNAGANPNAVAVNSGSVLEWAVECGNFRLVKVLLNGGADVNLIGNVTPLMTAARKGDRRAVKLLLNHGADIKVKVGSYTAAGYAQIYGYKNLLPLLQPSI